MNVRRYVSPQDVVVFVTSAFAFIAITTGAPFAAGIGVAAAGVIVLASIIRIRVIGQ